MYLPKISSQSRTRRRVRGSLWLACALAVALPAWFIATFALSDDTLAASFALVPIAAYVAWRISCELNEEDEAGISPLDRIWVQVERRLPDAAVRRVAWRTVRSVVAMGVIAGVVAAGFYLMPKREPPKKTQLPAIAAPPVEREPVIEPRQITGVFATRVEIFPKMSWPAYGTIASFFGSSDTLGIDIYVGGEAKALAAARGTVVYAGPDLCCGYGNTVVLEHEDGWVTTYGRLASLAVKQDERIKAGETLGVGGAPQGQARMVHFQVQRDGRAYDPLTVLPASQMGLPTGAAANQMCGSDAIALDANSVVKLIVTSEALLRYELEGASVTSSTPEAPPIYASVAGLLSLSLQVPPSGEASYRLHMSLRKPDDRIEFDCPLAVRNATDVPLSVAPAFTRPPLITPTPFGGPPTATPEPRPQAAAPQVAGATDVPVTDAPGADGRPVITPTPFGGNVARVIPTARPNTKPQPSKTQTPGPRVTVTPTPTKAPAQTFPRSYLGANAIRPPQP